MSYPTPPPIKKIKKKNMITDEYGKFTHNYKCVNLVSRTNFCSKVTLRVIILWVQSLRVKPPRRPLMCIIWLNKHRGY